MLIKYKITFIFLNNSFSTDLQQHHNRLPKHIADMIKLVHATKWNLVKTRQELNRSYKEVCIPVLEKCRFLLYEVRPAVSLEMHAFKKVNVLYKEPRVKTLVKKIIKNLKCGSHTSEIQKPEDIVNASIQSQSVERHRTTTEESMMKNCPSDSKCSSEAKSDTDDVNNGIKNGVGKSATDSKSSADSKNTTGQKNAQKNSSETKCEEAKLKLENSSNELKEDTSADKPKERTAENRQLLNSLVNKITDKQIKNLQGDNPKLMNAILEFVTQDNQCDIDTLRRAMYCQV